MLTGPAPIVHPLLPICQGPGILMEYPVVRERVDKGWQAGAAGVYAVRVQDSRR